MTKCHSEGLHNQPTVPLGVESSDGAFLVLDEPAPRPVPSDTRTTDGALRLARSWATWPTQWPHLVHRLAERADLRELTEALRPAGPISPR